MSKSLEKDKFSIRAASEPQETHVLAGLMARRFSCRAFRSDPVPRETIEAMLNIAQLTASWCNSQAWQVIITEGLATQRFSEALLASAATPEGAALATDFPRPARYTGRYGERRRETGWQLYEAVGIAQGDRAASMKQTLENYKFFGAPHAIIITSDRDLGVYGAVDCGGYVANLMLAAQSLGINTIAQAAIAMQSTCVRRFFDLPQDRLIVCGLSFGYADRAHPVNRFRTRRDGLDEVVRWVSS